MNVLVAIHHEGRVSEELLELVHLIPYTSLDHRLTEWIADPVGDRPAGEVASQLCLPTSYIRGRRVIGEGLGEIEVEPDRQIRFAR